MPVVSEKDAAVQAVLDAVLVAGPNPRIHWMEWAKLQRRWPTLAQALRALVHTHGRRSELR